MSLTEKLKTKIAAAEEHQTLLEASLAEAREKFRAGLISRNELNAASAEAEGFSDEIARLQRLAAAL